LLSDAVPNGIFQSNERGRWNGRRIRRSIFCSWHQDGNVYLAIRVVRIATTVSAEQRWAYPRDLKEIADDTCFAQIGHQEISLGIDVGRDVMGYLSGVVA
jgi:hypothetical protein